MSILIQSDGGYFEIGSDVLESHAISAAEYESKSAGATVAERDHAWDDYADSVQIGCGCCMDKKSYGASC